MNAPHKDIDKIIPFGPFIVGGFLIIIFSKLTTPELLELITVF